jgi:hypothetical protein
MRLSAKVILAFCILVQPCAIKQNSDAFQVAVFLGLDCPISQKYISRLNEIYLTYTNVENIEWSFIVPQRISKKEINDFIKEYNVRFSIEADNRALRKTKYFNATVTPEVIVIKNRKTLYKGAIDNWFFELGRYRLKTTEHYLVDAIDSILKNQEPAIKETTAIGCIIQRHSGH